MLGALTKQLLHDLKASWQKTALLGLLLIVGLVFWIPPLVRTVIGDSDAKPAVPQPSAAAATKPIQVPSTHRAQPSAAKSGEKSSADWERAELILATDPLVRSVEVAAIHGNPFHIDLDQFPPPVLFGDEYDDGPDTTGDQAANQQTLANSEPQSPEGLVLKSTVVGTNRKAALINSRLYYEGRHVRNKDGESYLLTAILPRKVILTRDLEFFELKIEPQVSSDGINVERESIGSTEQ